MYCDEMVISDAIIRTVNLEMELLRVWGLMNKGIGKYIHSFFYTSLHTAENLTLFYFCSRKSKFSHIKYTSRFLTLCENHVIRSSCYCGKIIWKYLENEVNLVNLPKKKKNGCLSCISTKKNGKMAPYLGISTKKKKIT